MINQLYLWGKVADVIKPQLVAVCCSVEQCIYYPWKISKGCLFVFLGGFAVGSESGPD